MIGFCLSGRFDLSIILGRSVVQTLGVRQHDVVPVLHHEVLPCQAQHDDGFGQYNACRV